MTPAECGELIKRRDDLAREIGTLREAIRAIDTPAFYGHSKPEQLKDMRQVLVMRERELDDIHGQLGELPGER